MDRTIGSVLQAKDLQRGSGAALFAQIAADFERRIHAGELTDGVRLPAVRVLAKQLAVNRATVQRAYRILEDGGLVASRVGSGTVVTAPEVVAAPAGAEDRPTQFSRGILELARAAESSAPGVEDDSIDFALLLPDVELFPHQRLSQAVQAALARGSEVLQYGSPAGLGALREGVAKRLVNQGHDVSAHEVLIVNGIQQALDLIAKVLLDPGDAVVVEAPTYANVLPLLKLYGGTVLAVPMDHDGILPDRLESVLSTHRPRFLYTMPSFQNPTGITMSSGRRRAVLNVCARHGTLIVEDGCEQDLHFAANPLPPLGALDRSGSVIHLGTFSKGLFPGLRLGYMVATGELREMLILAKRFSDYHADLLSQAVLAEIIERGDYDRHLELLRGIYRERMQFTVDAMARSLPPAVRWRMPSGGYKLWLELPRGVRASAVAAEARRRGVALLAGAPFYEGSDGEQGMRLSISRTDPARIEDGIKILGDVLRQAIAQAETGGSGHRTNVEAPSLV